MTLRRSIGNRHQYAYADPPMPGVTSQGSFARPVTRVYASARWAALRMTKKRNSRPRRCAGPFDHAFIANLMPLGVSPARSRLSAAFLGAPLNRAGKMPNGIKLSARSIAGPEGAE